MPAPRPITVVGAGIAGAACARALREAGRSVVVVDRGRAPGGRMASPELHGRRVDVGAGYFTVRDDGFQNVVEAWSARGLARPWTDTFSVLGGDGPSTVTTGPMRWATPQGLRSLVRDLLDGIEVHQDRLTTELPDGDVVLAMPDPQAARLVTVADAIAYDPVIAVVCGFPARTWTLAGAAFVHDHPDVEFVADDGARRGDDAAVLVAHSTSSLARRHLTEPDDAVRPVADALRDLLDVAAPQWTQAHRWTFAKPADTRGAAFGFSNTGDGRIVGLAGDQWCVEGAPRVESAWRSGTDLGAAVVDGALG